MNIYPSQPEENEPFDPYREQRQKRQTYRRPPYYEPVPQYQPSREKNYTINVLSVLGTIGMWSIFIYFAVVYEFWWLVFIGFGLSMAFIGVNEDKEKRMEKTAHYTRPKTLSELEYEYDMLEDHCEYMEELGRYDPRCR